MVDEEVTSPQITMLLEDLQKDWYLLKCYLLIHRRVPTTFGVAEVGPLGKANCSRKRFDKSEFENLYIVPSCLKPITITEIYLCG